MGEYEDFVQKLRDQGRDDLADEAMRWSNKELRRRIAHVVEVEREIEALEREIHRLKSRPIKQAALQRVGVDLDALVENPAAVEVIEAASLDEGKEFDEEALDEWGRSMVERYHLPVIVRR